MKSHVIYKQCITVYNCCQLLYGVYLIFLKSGIVLAEKASFYTIITCQSFIFHYLHVEKTSIYMSDEKKAIFPRKK